MEKLVTWRLVFILDLTFQNRLIYFLIYHVVKQGINYNIVFRICSIPNYVIYLIQPTSSCLRLELFMTLPQK